ncbi:MAG: hypothetical protein IGR92_00180 [Leptolyngbyaceae cyanobacterium T60_A2020_046]|nr:hypothetical protein [Leptolyngbyaceae cyanobacterium T60_A2020_046]
MRRWFQNGIWVGLGYLLSPLSWWNDLFFNLPIAWAFGYMVSLVYPGGLVPGTVVGYWLSNLAGLVMMQWGTTRLLQPDAKPRWWRDVGISLGTATLYTVIIAALVYWRVLQVPAELLGGLGF